MRHGYDTAGNLTTVTNSLNSSGTTYAYDGLNRLISVVQKDAAGNRTFFYYDEGGQLLATQGQNVPSTQSALMLWGVDGLIGYRYTDATGTNRARYFTYNLHGDLTQALDEAGNIAEVGAFNGHGMPLRDGAGVLAVGGMFGYGAKFGYVRDGESGFYLCGFRYYDPSSGRWVTRDPIEYAGGQNLYGYSGNDPVNKIDPSGLYELWLYTTQVISGYNHAFLVLHDVNAMGKPIAYYFEGNPQFMDAGDFAYNNFGDVTCDTGDFTDPKSQKRKDRATRTGKSRLVSALGISSQNVRNRLFQVMRRIESAQVPYHAMKGPNSNSVVRAMLEQGLGMNLGNSKTVTTQLGIWSLPGWDTSFPTGTF